MPDRPKLMPRNRSEIRKVKKSKIEKPFFKPIAPCSTIVALIIDACQARAFELAQGTHSLPNLMVRANFA